MEQQSPNAEAPRIVGRYMLHGEIASGGMATVRFGRLLGPVGFSRTVAIKCLHAQFAKDPEFTTMFLDEARLAARVRHPNVVPILDVVALDGELFIVMEYVQGESFARLLRATRARKSRIPLRIVASIMSGVLDGLHAAHEALSEQGDPLNIVHRDVSPQNVIVGLDGVPRVLDFGVAKAVGRLQTTREGQLKGKMPYMAPEQLRGGNIDRRTDVYAAAVVLWEALANQRLFKADDDVAIFGMVLEGNIVPPSSIIPTLPKGYDEVVMRGLHRDPAKRYQTSRDMAIALEKVAGVASPREIGAWVEQLAQDTLSKRAGVVAEIESVSSMNYASMVGSASPAMQSVEVSMPRPPQSSLPAPAPLPPPSPLPAPSPELFSSPATFIPTSAALNIAAMQAGENFDVSSRVVTSPSAVIMVQPQSKLLWTVVIIAVLAAVVAITALVVLLRTPGQHQVSSVTQIPTPVTTVTTALAQPPATETQKPIADTPPEAAATAKPSVPLGKVNAKAPATGATAKADPPKTDPPKADPPKPEQPPKSDCNTPYTIDARGVRVPKPQCL